MNCIHIYIVLWFYTSYEYSLQNIYDRFLLTLHSVFVCLYKHVVTGRGGNDIFSIVSICLHVSFEIKYILRSVYQAIYIHSNFSNNFIRSAQNQLSSAYKNKHKKCFSVKLIWFVVDFVDRKLNWFQLSIVTFNIAVGFCVSCDRYRK